MKRFKKIYIEITNVCNLRCSFCPETKRTPEFMTPETFRDILEQIKPYTDYVYFHVKGEPLLHPGLADFLDMCAEKNIKVNLTTNGTLIEDTADMLLAKPALRQINFSLHSFDGNDTSGGLEAYLNRIFAYIRRSAELSATLISLRLWNLGAQTGDTHKNDDILRQIERAFNLPSPIDAQAVSARGIKITDKVFLSQDTEFQWPALDPKPHREHIEPRFNKGFCYGLKAHLAILVDGTVVPCCLDGEGVIKLGNIRETPFSEILQNHRAVSIQQGFENRNVVEPLCRTCTYRNRFD